MTNHIDLLSLLADLRRMNHTEAGHYYMPHAQVTALLEQAIKKVGELKRDVFLASESSRRNHDRALGCQPQRFVVKLGEEHGTVFVGGKGVRVFSELAIIEAIKAAGGEVEGE